MQSKQVTAPYPAKIIAPEAGDLSEVFSAIQGEGSLVGERHLFIRLGGCPFRCHYCDTPEALVPYGDCLVETPPSSRKFRRVRNPIAPEALRAIAGEFLATNGVHRAIVLTGGEPLWQAGYLAKALPLLRQFGKRIYLETAGAHPGELKSIIEHLDVVAMDLKPPSASGLKPLWSAHREFIRTALAKELIVKIVVTRKTTRWDLEQCRDLVAEVDRKLPVILQPVTPSWKIKVSPTIAQLLGWQALMAEKLENVRVIPQVHRALGDR